MTDTWNDRDDYETSALESRDLFEQMCRDWSWPAPRTEHAATADQLEAANLDPGARDLDGLTPLERAALEVGIADDNARRARAAWVALLPHLSVDDDGALHCTHCRSTEGLRVREIGYERWTSAANDYAADPEPGVLYASSDGWDDMTEEGTDAWVYCIECDTAHQLPENVEWI